MVPVVISLGCAAAAILSGCWLLKIAFRDAEHKISAYHSGLAGFGMLALLAWLILAPRALPFVILGPGRGPAIPVLLTTITLSSLVAVLLCRPAISGALEERLAAISGLPFVLLLLGYLIWRLG
jgi:hypothetical protein